MSEDRLDVLYELRIITEGGTTYRIAGMFASLEKVYVEWRDSTFDGEGKVSVNGIANSARNEPCSITIDRGYIRGMILEEL